MSDFFVRQGLADFLPGLAPSCVPPDLYFLSTWDYRHAFPKSLIFNPLICLFLIANKNYIGFEKSVQCVMANVTKLAHIQDLFLTSIPSDFQYTICY
jgi:hypothetical protein